MNLSSYDNYTKTSLFNKLIIEPNKEFYNVYNNYINNPQNNESNSYILNLISLKSKLVIPEIITKKKFLELTTQTSNTYISNFHSNLNKKYQCCNICLENFNDNYIITPCNHIFCFLCYNKLCTHSKKKYNLFENNLNLKQINKKKINEQIKCPKCMNEFCRDKCYLISKSNIKNDKEKLIVQLFKKDKNIQKYFIQNIGYKTIYFLEKKEKFLQNSNSKFVIYLLIINQNWKKLIQKLLSSSHLKNINFLSIENLQNVNFKNKKFKIYIFEPLNLNHKQIINNFINNPENKLHNSVNQIIHIVIKNTIDEKIINNEVILN